MTQLTDEDIASVGVLAREAGQVAAGMRQGVSIQEKTGPLDLVTAADVELSRLIVDTLSKRFKSDVIISEEDEKYPGKPYVRSRLDDRSY